MRNLHWEITKLEERWERGVHNAVELDCEEPKMHNKMLKRPPEEQEKWMAGARKELHDFERRGVWRKIRKGMYPWGKA